jgi:hypothetical protein
MTTASRTMEKHDQPKKKQTQLSIIALLLICFCTVACLLLLVNQAGSNLVACNGHEKTFLVAVWGGVLRTVWCTGWCLLLLCLLLLHLGDPCFCICCVCASLCVLVSVAQARYFKMDKTGSVFTVFNKTGPVGFKTRPCFNKTGINYCSNGFQLVSLIYQPVFVSF